MRRFLDSSVKAIDRIARLQIAIAGAALFGALAVNLVGVIMRYVFRSPIRYSVELPSLLLVLMIGLALAYAQKEKAHVRVSAVITRLPARGRKTLNAITGALFLLYVVFIAWGTWDETWRALRGGIRSLEAGIPIFLSYIFIPIGLAAMCLQIILDICRAFGSPSSESEANQDFMTGHDLR